MEVVAIISIFVTGVLLGVVGLDFRQRVKVGLELRDVLAKIQEVHNAQAKQIVDMQERVNVHEFKLSGKK